MDGGREGGQFSKCWLTQDAVLKGCAIDNQEVGLDFPRCITFYQGSKLFNKSLWSGSGTVETLEVKSHLRSQVGVIKLERLEQLRVHYVDGASLVNQDSTDVKIFHSFPGK